MGDMAAVAAAQERAARSAARPVRPRSSSDKISRRRMLCAAIDIGSNTTRVLVAEPEEGQLRKVMEQRAYTRIGKDVDQGRRRDLRREDRRGRRRRRHPGPARPGARRRGDPDRRDRRDPRGRERRGRRRGDRSAPPGIPVEVLSDHEEGRLAFIGATKALGHPVEGEIGVVDVGGGSSEVIARHDRRGRPRGPLVPDRLRRPRRGADQGRSSRARPRSASCASGSRTSSRTSSSTIPTRRSPSAAARPRCAGSSARSSSTRRSSAASAC